MQKLQTARIDYIDRFIRSRCAGRLLSLGLFPNAKEITESVAIFEAWQNFFQPTGRFARKDKRVVLVSVGDGHVPRTAAFFAHMTAWKCYSIDPELNYQKYWNKDIPRLTYIKSKIEDQDLQFDDCSDVLIVAVHSHAPMMDVLKHIHSGRRSLIALPCCEKSYADNAATADEVYDDPCVWSPMRKVMIWNDV